MLRLMFNLPSTLLTPLSHRYSSFEGVFLSVADVLKGIRTQGFTQAGWEALLRYWVAVCRHGPSGPICSLHPWDEWISPDLHGFYQCL